MEIWRPVVGYEGYYEVSDQGRVRSLDRIVPSRRRPNEVRRLRGVMLKVHYDRDGYPKVMLHRNGIQHHRTVHSLVAEAFIGPRPDGLDICHGNNNASDPNVDNLRYDTRKANEADKIRRRPERCPQGHLYDDANTYVHPVRGTRQCRTCRADGMRGRNSQASR